MLNFKLIKKKNEWLKLNLSLFNFVEPKKSQYLMFKFFNANIGCLVSDYKN